METIRFVIITVPPVKIQKEINKFRKEMSKCGNTFEALTYPPHITLRTGAVVPKENLDIFFEGFERHIFDTVNPFIIETQGIEGGTYLSGEEKKYYYYYKIKLSEKLDKLNKNLLQYDLYKKSNKTQFMPHITMAFDDLTIEEFNNIKKEMYDKIKSAPNYSWTFNNIGFYYFNGYSWKAYKNFKLEKSNTLV